MADCLIFGKIAGENAAKIKDEQVVSGANVNENNADTAFPESDVKEESYSTAENQYIGKSSSGMGNEIIVRVTVDSDKRPSNIEVLKESESPDYGEKAIKKMKTEMLAQKTTNVDAVSGASASSRAFKEAVESALKQA